MTQPNLLERAREGNAQAIATLMNRHLQTTGITAKATLKDSRLQVMLESAQVPDEQAMVAFVRNGMMNLDIESLRQVRVYGRQTGEDIPAWTQEFTLETTSKTQTPPNSLPQVPPPPLRIPPPPVLNSDDPSFDLASLITDDDSDFDLSGLVNEISASLLPSPPQVPTPSATPIITPYVSEPTEQLVSAVGMNYERLRDLLAAENWKEADWETTVILLKVSGRSNEHWLRVEDIENFPSPDLCTIDQLWVQYSNGRFGFSVQKRIWESVGGKLGADWTIYNKFGDRVGWRVNGNWLSSQDDHTFSLSASEGHLPQLTPPGILGSGPLFVGAFLSGLIGGALGMWSTAFGSLLSRHELTSAKPIAASMPTAPVILTPALQPWRCVNTLTGHLRGVESVAISSDGQMLASGSNDKTIKIWRLGTGEEVHTLTGHSGWFAGVNSVAISPDKQTVVSGSADFTIKLWQIATGRQIRTFIGHSQSVNSVAISPDGQTVVSGSADFTIKLWQIATGKEILTLPGHSSMVNSVAISPDGQTIASGSYDKTIKLWRIGSRKLVRTLTGHLGPVECIAISGDGQILASSGGYEDNTIKLWRLGTGGEILTLSGHSSPVKSVAFHPDGRTLASGSDDKTIIIWQLGTGKKLCTLTGHSNLVRSVAFRPDGRTLVSGSADNTIMIWRYD